MKHGLLNVQGDIKMNKYILAFDRTSIFLSNTSLYSDKYIYLANTAFEALQQHIEKTGENRKLLSIKKKVTSTKWQDINIYSGLTKH